MSVTRRSCERPHDSEAPLHGQVLRRREVNGLTLVKAMYRSGQHIPWHRHPHARLVCAIRGVFIENVFARSVESEPFAVLFRPPDEPHSNLFGNRGGMCLSVDLPPSWMAWAGRNTPSLERVQLLRHDALGDIVNRLVFEFDEPDAASALAVEGLMLQIVAEVSRDEHRDTAASPPRWLKDVEALLRARFREPISLREIAQSVAVHPTHMARVFRQHHHDTVGGYLRGLRIEYALRLLSSSRMPIGDLAIAAGFCGQTHLWRAVKRRTGMSPGEYRRHCGVPASDIPTPEPCRSEE